MARRAHRFGRSIAAVGTLGLLSVGGCCLPGGHSTPPQPQLTASVASPLVVDCVLGCTGSTTVTVSNPGNGPTTAGVTLALQSPDARYSFSDGSCTVGVTPVPASGSCTYTLSFNTNLTQPNPTEGEGNTVVATSGSLQASASFEIALTGTD